MNISGVNSYGSTLSLADLYGTQETDSSGDSSSLASSSSSSTARSDSLDLSKPAEIYSKLLELAKSDPEKLKEVCASIAEKLKSASQSESGPGSKMLADLAEKFQSVADGGDVSVLKPPEPPSFPGGTQGPIDKYSEQQDAQLIEMLMNSQGSQSSSGSNMEQLMSSILDKLNEALAG